MNKLSPGVGKHTFPCSWALLPFWETHKGTTLQGSGNRSVAKLTRHHALDLSACRPNPYIKASSNDRAWSWSFRLGIRSAGLTHSLMRSRGIECRAAPCSDMMPQLARTQGKQGQRCCAQPMMAEWKLTCKLAVSFRLTVSSHDSWTEVGNLHAVPSLSSCVKQRACRFLLLEPRFHLLAAPVDPLSLGRHPSKSRNRHETPFSLHQELPSCLHGSIYPIHHT